MEPQYGGVLSHDETESPANITWIIRWRDRAERDKAWKELRSAREWRAILSKVPGGRASYLKTEAKFATEING